MRLEAPGFVGSVSGLRVGLSNGVVDVLWRGKKAKGSQSSEIVFSRDPQLQRKRNQ